MTLTLFGVQEVKFVVDISKAHGLFYVPCLEKCAEQMGYVELCSVDKEPHATVDMHWHDKLEFPVTRWTVGRLGVRQRSNRFFKMIHAAKKNPLAKARLTLLFTPHQRRSLGATEVTGEGLRAVSSLPALTSLSLR